MLKLTEYSSVDLPDIKALAEKGSKTDCEEWMDHATDPLFDLITEACNRGSNITAIWHGKKLIGLAGVEKQLTAESDGVMWSFFRQLTTRQTFHLSNLFPALLQQVAGDNENLFNTILKRNRFMKQLLTKVGAEVFELPDNDKYELFVYSPPKQTRDV